MCEQLSSTLRLQPLEILGQLLKLTLQTASSLSAFIASVPELLAASLTLPISLDVVVNLKKDVMFTFAWPDSDKIFAAILKTPNENSSLVNLASLRGTHTFLAELSKGDSALPMDPLVELAVRAVENLKTTLSFGNVE